VRQQLAEIAAQPQIFCARDRITGKTSIYLYKGIFENSPQEGPRVLRQGAHRVITAGI
jgi:hypothetical protein